jgi:hypothetical protein
MEQIDIFVASLTSFWTELASFIRRNPASKPS